MTFVPRPGGNVDGVSTRHPTPDLHRCDERRPSRTVGTPTATVLTSRCPLATWSGCPPPRPAAPAARADRPAGRRRRLGRALPLPRRPARPGARTGAARHVHAGRLPRRRPLLPAQRVRAGVHVRRPPGVVLVAGERRLRAQPVRPGLARARADPEPRPGHRGPGGDPRGGRRRAPAYPAGVPRERRDGAHLVQRPAELQRPGVVDQLRVVRLPARAAALRGGGTGASRTARPGPGGRVVRRDAGRLRDHGPAQRQPRAHVLRADPGRVRRRDAALPCLGARWGPARPARRGRFR